VRRTSRPPGLLLGGGFDSGAIAGLAVAALAPRKQALVAVSSVMPDSDRHTPLDARHWVEMLQRHMPGLEVRYVTREGGDIFTGLLEDFVGGGGTGSPNRYANRLLYDQLGFAGVRLVMSGDAGDYTLNPRRNNALLVFLRSGRWRLFLREIRAHRAAVGASYTKLLLRDILRPLLPWRLLRPFERVRRGLAPFGPTVPVSREFFAQLRAQGLAGPVRRPSLRPRHEALKDMLLRSQRGGAPGGSVRAAAGGMELTLPYLDKRVVELALAVPDTLMFRNGRDRHLARKALADILPPAFQTRGSANDDMIPDYLAMIARAEPKILAEIDRMEKEGRLGRYFDLARMRRMFSGRDTPLRRGRKRQAVEHAARAFLHARYIEWFMRGNTAGE
jgi:asparagine synthase (glutamine-hydrolysing)